MTTTHTRVDVAEPLRELCERLGLVYENVSHLKITPGYIEADVFKTNEDGRKYLVGGEVARDTFRFDVST